MEKRFTIQARPQGTPFWIEIEKGLTAEEAADMLTEEMHDDAKWDDNYEYQIIPE